VHVVGGGGHGARARPLPCAARVVREQGLRWPAAQENRFEKAGGDDVKLLNTAATAADHRHLRRHVLAVHGRGLPRPHGRDQCVVPKLVTLRRPQPRAGNPLPGFLGPRRARSPRTPAPLGAEEPPLRELGRGPAHASSSPGTSTLISNHCPDYGYHDCGYHCNRRITDCGWWRSLTTQSSAPLTHKLPGLLLAISRPPSPDSPERATDARFIRS
jgi:hypothetical protein